MKNNILILMLIIMAVSIFPLVGCSPETTSEGEPYLEKPAKEEVININFAHPYPVAHYIHPEILVPLTEELREKSNGRINITLHPGGALSGTAEMYQDVVSGAVDLGWTTQYAIEGRFPLTEVFQLPFLFESTEEIAAVMWELFETSDVFRSEYSEVKVLNLFSADPSHIRTATIPVYTIDDMKGLRISCLGALGTHTIESLNAIPIAMGMADTYDALERGVIDGVMGGQSSSSTFSHYEVVKYFNKDMGISCAPMMMIMNKDLWDSLLPEDQELIDNLTGKVLSVECGKLYDWTVARAQQKAEEEGVEMITLPKDEMEKFIEATANVNEKWIADREARGLPAKKVYEQMIRIRDEYRSR